MKELNQEKEARKKLEEDIEKLRDEQHKRELSDAKVMHELEIKMHQMEAENKSLKLRHDKMQHELEKSIELNNTKCKAYEGKNNIL